MALSDSALSSDLMSLYDEMDAKPMDKKVFADKMAAILDKQTLTAEVLAGIKVDGGTASGGSLIGCATSVTGSLQ